MNYLNNKIKDNLKYLDKILELNLQNGYNYKIEIQKLAININPIDFSSLFSETFAERLTRIFTKPNKSIWKNLENTDFELYISEESNSEASKFINALFYLHQEELIIFTPYPINTSLLTFRGMIKISSGGFYMEYKREKKKELYEKFAWIVSILTFIAGWMLKPLLVIFQNYLK